ncbi:MAG: hypothetical protein KC733_04660 [Candidatus Omnitrophica bacterium]|nr:hypothetical protein [Candidatus Omnitrophota bacterium]
MNNPKNQNAIIKLIGIYQILMGIFTVALNTSFGIYALALFKSYGEQLSIFIYLHYLFPIILPSILIITGKNTLKLKKSILFSNFFILPIMYLLTLLQLCGLSDQWKGSVFANIVINIIPIQLLAQILIIISLNKLSIQKHFISKVR